MTLSIGSTTIQSPARTPSMMITPSLPSSSASGPAIADVSDEIYEDCCSICLEPFNSQNPPTVTSCRHEYHLQCILDWSQRSQECPICLQVFVLTDPACQELLAAMGSERSMRSMSYALPVLQDHEVGYDPPVNHSDFLDGIMQHLASAPIVAHVVNRRRRQASSAVDPSLGFPSVSVANLPTMPHHHDPQEECKSRSHGPASPTVDNEDVPLKLRIFFGLKAPDGPSRLRPSELLSLSESVKAKLNSASTRYKESLSKSTHGFKEKLLARNSSVKEFSRGVQREMSASISRVIERLDLSSKRSDATIPSSSCPVDSLNLPCKGKDLEWHVEEQPCDNTEAILGKSSDILKSDFTPSRTCCLQVMYPAIIDG